MMSEKSEFLPFNAINEFMRPDFRLTIIRETLSAQQSLPEELNRQINQKIKRLVKIPGFRNSDKAPALVKILPVSKAFEKDPELVAVLLSCWAELQSELREQIYQLLRHRNWRIFENSANTVIQELSSEFIKIWPILPVNIDRTKLPGFSIHWPSGEDFESIYKDYTEQHPTSEVSMDKISLMVVWLTMRLPYVIDEGADISEQ